MCNLVFVGYQCWSRRRRPARGAPPEGAGRGQRQASPGARREFFSAAPPSLGLARLGPTRSRRQRGKAPVRCFKAPGDMSGGPQTCIPPDRRKMPGRQTSTVSIWATQKRRVASSVAHQRFPQCSTLATYATHCEDPASRGLCSAYIACASKTTQQPINTPQPWARAASASPSSSPRSTRIY